MKQININDAFSFAFQTLKKYPLLLLGPVLFFSFLNNLLQFLHGENPGKVDYIADSPFFRQLPDVTFPILFNILIGVTLLVTILVVITVFSITLTIGRFRIAFYAFDNKVDDLKWSVYNNFGNDIIGRYFCTSLFLFLMILVGTIFLFIPGIILHLMFQFTGFVLVEKQVTIKNAFKISYKLTDGIKGSLFGYNMLFGLLQLIIFLPILILERLNLYYWWLPLSAIVVPVVNMFILLVKIGIYKDISAQEENLEKQIANFDREPDYRGDETAAREGEAGIDLDEQENMIDQYLERREVDEN